MFVSNLKNISLMKLIRNFNYTTFKNLLFHSFVKYFNDLKHDLNKYTSLFLHLFIFT